MIQLFCIIFVLNLLKLAREMMVPQPAPNADITNMPTVGKPWRNISQLGKKKPNIESKGYFGTKAKRVTEINSKTKAINML